MNGRFVLGVYATPATKKLRPTLGEYRHRFRMWMLRRSIVGKTPSRPIWLIARST
jgi:hypothetical protein